MRGQALVQDARRSPAELSCAHCHASRAQLEAGQLSPGPPWPGTLQRTTLKGERGLPPAQAVLRCAATYQDPPPTPQQVQDVLAFLETQGTALQGQPTLYDPQPRPPEEARALLALPPDLDHGQDVFVRACARCHQDGPGYGLDVLQAQARLEVLEKLCGVPAKPRKSMPHFPRQVLSNQDLADVASYVSP